LKPSGQLLKEKRVEICVTWVPMDLLKRKGNFPNPSFVGFLSI
jgi:hypothetical protein